MGKIDVTTRGGFGNQFFVVSAAIHVSKLTGKIAVLDFLDGRAGVANHGNSNKRSLQKLGYKSKFRPKKLAIGKNFRCGKAPLITIWDEVRTQPRRFPSP